MYCKVLNLWNKCCGTIWTLYGSKLQPVVNEKSTNLITHTLLTTIRLDNSIYTFVIRQVHFGSTDAELNYTEQQALCFLRSIQTFGIFTIIQYY